MGSVRRWFSWITDRRRINVPVSDERRGRKRLSRMQEADKRLEEAMERLDRTVRLERKDWKYSANDMQQEVIFPTFRSVCRYALEAGEHRLCRHPLHEAANTGIAPCAEEICPILLGATKAA